MKSTIAIILCFLGIQIVTAEQNPAFYAIQQNDTKFLKESLKKNLHNTSLNEDGQTILHAAILTNNIKAVKTILRSGFTCINKFDKYGKTAMDYAVEHGRNKMVKELYKNKGKVTSVENQTYTQKIITKPYKIVFFIGLSIFSLMFIFIPMAGSFGGYKIMTGLFYGFSGGIPMIIGASGWITRSKVNLLPS